MANRQAAIRKGDAVKIFEAALKAGFETARIVVHPDGRIEATASLSETAADATRPNTWDDVLK